MDKETLQIYSDVFDAIGASRDAIAAFSELVAPRTELPLRLTMMNAVLREIKSLDVTAAAARGAIVYGIAQGAKLEYDELIKTIGLPVDEADRLVDLRSGYTQIHQRTDREFKRGRVREEAS